MSEEKPGGGMYEELCTEVRELTHALGAIVIVIKGDQGSGFAAQVPSHLRPAMADVLMQVAAKLKPTLGLH